MIIDTSDFGSSPRAVAYTFPRPSMEGTVGDGADVRLVGSAQRVEGGVRLSGRLETRVSVHCARCTRVFELPIEADFSLLYRNAGARQVTPEEIVLTEEACKEAELDSHGGIDVINLAREQVYLMLPLKPVCTDDCRGLCTRCGADLNQKICSCPVLPPDPRWSALTEIKAQITTNH